MKLLRKNTKILHIISNKGIKQNKNYYIYAKSLYKNKKQKINEQEKVVPTTSSSSSSS